VIICPPPSEETLHPEWIVPHPGFGTTELYRNGVLVWSDLFGEWWDAHDEKPRWTVGQLTEWCPVRQGVGWKLRINGPMKDETYRLRGGKWVLTERGMGFA
jgi:hypothetical protein